MLQQELIAKPRFYSALASWTVHGIREEQHVFNYVFFAPLCMCLLL